jgi:hypothetical protein
MWLASFTLEIIKVALCQKVDGGSSNLLRQDAAPGFTDMSRSGYSRMPWGQRAPVPVAAS